jgi:uncharacterized repeat protein (TIGR03803 family)
LSFGDGNSIAQIAEQRARAEVAGMKSVRAVGAIAIAILGGCHAAPSFSPSVSTSQYVGAGPTAARAKTAVPNEIILHRFSEHSRTDAAGPLTGVIIGPNGAFYGTAVFGGTTGNGTVFEVAPTSKGGFRERILHNFGIGADGAKPGSGLIVDASGAFYTNTVIGGAFGAGTVVKLTPTPSGYQERILYNFHGGFDGSQPIGSLVIDKSGAIYGATQFGGSSGFGIIFKLTPSDSYYNESVAYDFPASGAEGNLPQAGLTSDSAGNIYGTTYYGGLNSLCNGAGCGVVFKLTPGAHGFTESVIHAFSDGTDGAQPFGELTVDEKTGDVYGTTDYGGGGCAYGSGCGTVFKLAPTGSSYTEKVLWAFSDREDGAYPQGKPLVGAAGVIYGTASWGGNGCRRSGCGNAFTLTPGGKRYYNFAILHQFTSNDLDGADPEGSGLIADSSGNLYGTTRSGGGRRCSDGGPGGVRGCGVLFEIQKL